MWADGNRKARHAAAMPIHAFAQHAPGLPLEAIVLDDPADRKSVV